MTKQEIYKSEQSNDKDIILYPEGKFYKAYERSAWRLCMLVHEFKVSCRWVGTAGAYIVSVGFPLESLGKWMSEWACSYLPEGCVVASCAGSEMHASLPFDEWKELQINATAQKVRKAKEEHSGDIGLRLYGLSYRLALELAKDAALLNRQYRYSLGEQIRMSSFHLSLDVEVAGLSGDKLAPVERAVEGVRELQLCMRMLVDLNALPQKRYVYYLEMMTDISKQLHNWERSLRRKEQMPECEYAAE